MKNTGDTQK